TSVLRAGPSRPAPIIETLRARRPTVFFSVPALYAALVRDPAADRAFDSVRVCVSAAEALPPRTFERWRERFGLDIIDGIGSTEMLHIFCSNSPGRVEPGTTGRPVPGYELRVVDEDGEVVEAASRIAAFVECDGEPSDELADELRGWCKERLRRYEYPHIVEFVDELPRTLTGKVQRFRLRERAEHRSPA